MEMQTINLKEAAKFLGFTGTQKLGEKAKRGEIPGAFKVGKCWMFYVPDLVDFVRGMYATYGKTAQVGMTGDTICQSARKKTALSIIRGSQSAVSACRNQRELLREERRKSMKKNVEEK